MKLFIYGSIAIMATVNAVSLTAAHFPIESIGSYALRTTLFAAFFWGLSPLWGKV